MRAIEAEKTVTALAVLAAVCLLSLPTQSAGSMDVLRETVVCLNPGTITMPEDRDSATLGEVTISSPALESILSADSVEFIRLALPSFAPEDTIGVSLSGDTVRLQDWRYIYEFRFPVGTDVESLCTELEDVSEVIFAEPNDTAVLCLDDPNDPGYENQGHSGDAICNCFSDPGRYNLGWDARGDRRNRLSEGVYFLDYKTSNCRETRKLIVQ